MTKRMLIDAAHPEETRVVVADDHKLEELDTETSTKKQLKGNIYLAKVTRVEPSLQAAFVEYGGNRHGFLAFNEIHPDYYRIPVEDREALLAETAAAAAAAADDNDDDGEGEGDNLETLGGDDDEIERVGEAQRQRLRSLTRQYRIQEVIKRRQILLVQVVKEERGNKGAALTTYMSLAGRYCVLMPNTARGGGISRKIVNPAHRKRLKSILTSLEVPDGMAVILRTAGVERSRVEMRRDYDYLRRTWDEIRELTLKSTAPSLIYEEGNLIKRSLRDLYTREIEEIIIDGDEAYKTARTLMRTMIPSHVRRVQKYAETTVPLFHKFKIEAQLDAIHEQTVHLPAGGYIVINPTEALVAIDVNSGRATRERNIEQTARRTNLEAAEEVARQLRLRDLAGLIVIDFIDMDDAKNNAAVERRLKEAMKNDRARIQVGRISAFGLLELSRQRLRPSLAEANAETCPTCGGAGHVRSTESAALRVLRGVEEECLRRKTTALVVRTPANVALYLLNQKRAALNDITARHGVALTINVDDGLIPPAYELERTRGSGGDEAEAGDVVRQGESSGREPARRDSSSQGSGRRDSSSRDSSSRDGEGREGRGRRRGRRKAADGGSRDETTRGLAEADGPLAEADGPLADANGPLADDGDGARREANGAQRDDDDLAVRASRDDAADSEARSGDDEQDRPRRRRGRRGGRRRRRDNGAEAEANTMEASEDDTARDDTIAAGDEAGAGDDEDRPEGGALDAEPTDSADTVAEEKPARRRTRGGRRRRSAAPPTEDTIEAAKVEDVTLEDVTVEDVTVEVADEAGPDEAVAAPAAPAETAEEAGPAETAEAGDDDAPKKRRTRRGGRRRTRARSDAASSTDDDAGADDTRVGDTSIGATGSGGGRGPAEARALSGAAMAAADNRATPLIGAAVNGEGDGDGVVVIGDGVNGPRGDDRHPPADDAQDQPRRRGWWNRFG